MFRNLLRFSHSSFLKSSFDQILSYRSSLSQRKVIDFRSPEELSQIIDFSIPKISNSNEKILDLTQKVLDFSVNPSHPHFFNTLFSGADEYSLVGDFLTSALNGVMYSYEMAPVFNLMEESVMRHHRELIGWEKSEGVFCPGGSVANLYGLLLARHHYFPEVRKAGMAKLPNLAIFTSELGHFSLEKAALITGIGLDNVYKVETDIKGKMIPTSLESKILEAKKAGKTPFFVNATVGTTVFGAIDPVDEIAEICRKKDLWLHVDACFGGPLFFLEDRRKAFEKGTKLADSLVFDPHKVFDIPLQCSIFMTKHQGLMKMCNSTKADYLFMEDKSIYDARRWDLGDGAIQCGRHVDVLKYWLYLKAHGIENLERKIRKALENAKYLAEIVKSHENFELILEPEFLAVNFFFYSDRIKKEINEKGVTNEIRDEIGRISPILKEKMMRKGSLMLAYQKQKQEGRILNNFFRPIVTVNKTKEDMEFVVEEMCRLGKDL